MTNNKGIYREFCKIQKDIPIFSKDWWLDSVCGLDGWNVAIVQKGGEIVASMPYVVTKKHGFDVIYMPQFTQTMGSYIVYPENQQYYKRLSWEKELMSELIDNLPNFDHFEQNFHSRITNWLPFYWKGFKNTTKYSYRIPSIKNIQEVFNNFAHSKRKNINKAKNIVDIKFDLSCDEFYKNHEMTLKKQKAQISYTKETFENIYNNAYANNSGRTIYAIDKDGNIHGALFVIWDNESAYDLISTIDPDFRNSGAASLLVYKMIEYVSSFVDIFDFEGSMIEYVENSFRQFGAIQTPYFTISKTNSRLYELLHFTKNFLRSNA